MTPQASSADPYCPRLGLLHDRASSYAYPHGHNACYAVEPACPVRLEHQSDACLSGRYRTCSLYHFQLRLGEARSPLPPEVVDQALVVDRRAGPPLWQLAALAVLIAATLLLAWSSLPGLQELTAAFASFAAPAAPLPCSGPQKLDT